MTEGEYRKRLAMLGYSLNTGYHAVNGLYNELGDQQEAQHHYLTLEEAVNRLNSHMVHVTREHKRRVAEWDKKEKENQPKEKPNE